MIEYKTLGHTALEDIYQTFVSAFGDYQVKFDLSFETFKNMMVRRGLNRHTSIGAFDNDELIGFVLTGLREWDGLKTAYDLGTGVVPAHRNQGISSRIVIEINKVLRANNVEQFLLEVIQSNEAAYHLYLKQNFQITRNFNCFFLTKTLEVGENKFLYQIIEYPNEALLKSFWDCNPAWQNSFDSIKSSLDSFLIIGAFEQEKLVGYGLVTKDSGDVPQLAVSKDYRNRGIGSNLIKQLQNHTLANKLAFLNIDANALEVNEFLLKHGFSNDIQQYEMVLQLKK